MCLIQERFATYVWLIAWDVTIILLVIWNNLFISLCNGGQRVKNFIVRAALGLTHYFFHTAQFYHRDVMISFSHWNPPTIVGLMSSFILTRGIIFSKLRADNSLWNLSSLLWVYMGFEAYCGQFGLHFVTALFGQGDRTKHAVISLPCTCSTLINIDITSIGCTSTASYVTSWLPHPLGL